MNLAKGCVFGFMPLAITFLLICSACAQEQISVEIKLPAPNNNRGTSLMNALTQRASFRSWAEKEMDKQDISDLLWAANGINRPEKGLRTAPSAHNAQDIDIFLFSKERIYLYNPEQHSLITLKTGDFRSQIGRQNYVGKAPISLILVSDIRRFKKSDTGLCLNWAALDAGMISQNISLFCAATDMGTVPRTFFNDGQLRKLLALKNTQHIMIHHPVGYIDKN